MTINGEAVDSREFMLFFNRSHSATVDYFTRHYGAEDGPNFWTQHYNGEIPLEHAKAHAMDTLVRTKIQQQLAHRYGILDDTSYRAFLVALSVENQTRERISRDGDVIYGLKQYGEDDYYQERMAKIVIALQLRWSQDSLVISDDARHESYDQHKTQLYQSPDGTFMPFADVNTRQYWTSTPRHL